ncbi:expressed unknown protein [Seminavis robusta]|uniref:DUF305 domain-containing protein n=1 Tax=Seminavis robusta TaxID=568900 RepID=A0A9N8DLE1_9STRA|nr:expressed unknown protein [Seminavis robusta]|eukprot:Sro146_g067420.1 n/a (444) ;mRNA; f:2846-4761
MKLLASSSSSSSSTMMPVTQRLLVVHVALLLSGLSSVSAELRRNGEICVSPTNTYTAKVDIHASERGYYVFEECGEDWVNPTIGLEFGQVYTFIQKHKSNYWHPIDFSYFPDAHHVGAELLDPRTKGNDGGDSIISNLPNQQTTTTSAASANGPADTCATNMTCPAPMYFLNDGYLGTYSNIKEVAPITSNEHDIGLELYEDFFFKSMATWTGFGTFSIQLKFDDESYTGKDIFYYCRIHQFMAGRMKLLKNGVPVNEQDDPPMYFEMETPGQFDAMCGTYGLDAFQLPHPQCPDRFVCDVDERMRDFASCIDAMDCHMILGMTTKVSSKTELALFVHQMIPHHQNAVNMAKALLKAGFLPCDDLTNEEDPYCIMQSLLYGIVNRQNHEIGVMSKILAGLNLPPTDDCEVLVGDEGLHGSSRGLKGMAVTAAGAMFGAAAHAF